MDFQTLTLGEITEIMEKLGTRQQKLDQLEKEVAQVHEESLSLLNLMDDFDSELQKALDKKQIIETADGNTEGALMSESTNGYHPLELLPLEMWNEVFIRVEDSKDLISFSQVSSILSTFLEARKCEMLFLEILPFITWYLKRDDIYKCREVCRLWRSSVNNFIETTASTIVTSKHLKSIIEMKFYSLNMDRIQSCLDNTCVKFQPFVGKTAAFSNNRENNYWSKIMEVLQCWGEKITTCTFCICELPEEAMKTIRDALCLLPNLKQLSINNSNPVIGYEVLRGWGELVPKLDNPTIHGVKLVLRTYPLPELPHLEKVTFSYVSLVFQDCILSKYASQLKSIIMLGNCTKSAEKMSCPRLEQLNLNIYFSNELVRNGWTSCALKTLHLKILPMTDVHFNSLVSLLNKQATTLKDLALLFLFQQDEFSSKKLDKIQHLKLPNLEKFEIENFHGSLDFLKGMCSLQHFTHTYIDPSFRPNMSKQSIQIFGYEARMYDSNIWTVIPTLKSASLRRGHVLLYYYRKLLDYLKYMRERP